MKHLSALACVVFLSACASKAPAPAPAPAPAAAPAVPANTQVVKSIDGTYTGEIVGKPAPGSRFAKLKIGMSMQDVHALIKAPDDMTRHETGKRWIPFYFGNDSQRVLTYYAGEGCLSYTGGNVFGAGGGQLVRIVVDKTKGCFQ